MTEHDHDHRRHPRLPIVRDDFDLLDLWRAAAPRYFGSRTLLMLILDPDSRPVPNLMIQIDDLPEQADAASCAGLIELCEHVLHDNVVNGSIAFALGRRGTTMIESADRAWAMAIATAAHGRCVNLRTMHLATPDGVRALSYDDVLTR